ncbi:MAG: malate permease [Spiroplasma poulsonii]|uniref:Membrane transport protein n=1 Tax=Spiroplasma poulsonii TaxID=2138 RepID=A0A2P6FBU8_9MOLU|nr:AEC family transporter [Spiroplasma poulsonii]KAF0851338.1 Membrane transport protein [Spiroplasma poulsonii]MBW1241681.1 malate permease [Spiroplasma poulsonii]PQM30931.1 Membrane transport protein [Spiroplasma poulsonii]PWF95925.1 Membrane transport protein [Spiroplasma poulsonii]PWF98701.1 Membrane transport protein [Spiroplasma poulsonii]
MQLLLDENKVSKAIIDILTAWRFWSAIIATIFVIFLGWLLTKKVTLKQEWDVVFIKILVVIGLPALVFEGFMSDATVENVKQEAAVLLSGFLFYIILGIIAKYFYIKYDRDVQDALSMSITFAATSFFGIPIVTALFPGSDAKIASNIFNVPYYVFLYSLGFIIMGKDNKGYLQDKVVIRNSFKNRYAYGWKMFKTNSKKILLNPILLATIIGFTFWVTQLIPGIAVVPDQNVLGSGKSFSSLRLDNTFPPIKKILVTLQAICTPLACLAIGINLTKETLKDSLKSFKTWYGTIMKVLLAPVIGLVITLIVTAIGKETGAWTMSSMGLTIIIIMLAAPPASVIVAYSINFKKETLLTSNVTLLSTLMSIIILPFWIIVTTAIGSISLFT